MDRVEEIEAAIEALPPEQLRRIVSWVLEREQTGWDGRIDADADAGKLDFLFEEAEQQSAGGLLREWPSPE